MKKLQQISMVVVLTLMLATGTFAGIIETGVTGDPPPNPPLASAPDPGSAIATGASDQQTPEDSFGMVALNLLQTVLTVF
jgi:predicted cobalt transporter CbtA